jgi:hypothetical protein
MAVDISLRDRQRSLAPSWSNEQKANARLDTPLAGLCALL